MKRLFYAARKALVGSTQVARRAGNCNGQVRPRLPTVHIGVIGLQGWRVLHLTMAKRPILSSFNVSKIDLDEYAQVGGAVSG